MDLKVGSDADTENGGKQTTSRNIFDESAVLKKVSWKEFLQQECNKANFSNLVTFAVAVVGLVLRITQGEDDLFARCVLSAGLFGFSGGITNAIAVKMLFDKIYVAPGISLIGSGIIENKFKEIRTTLKNTMMKSFFVLDYMKGYIERAVAKVFVELETFLSSADFEDMLSTALDKAMSTEVMKDMPEELRPWCHVFLEDLSQHMNGLESAGQQMNGLEATGEPAASKVGDIPSVACLRPHLAKMAHIAAPVMQEQLPRVATSPSVLPILRKEAEASIRNSIEAQDAPAFPAQDSPAWRPGLSCLECGGTPVGAMVEASTLNTDGSATPRGGVPGSLPQPPNTQPPNTWSAQFYQSIKHSVADTAVGYVVNDDFPAKVHNAVSKMDVEQLLLAAANSDELTSSIDDYIRSKVGTSPRRADFFRRTLSALQQLLVDGSKERPWPPHVPVCTAKRMVASLFDTAAPDLQKQLPLLVTEKNVHRMRVQIDKLLEERLQSMSKKVVKRMVEDVMRQHCQWLIVWGNVFGGIIGIISTLLGY